MQDRSEGEEVIATDLLIALAISLVLTQAFEIGFFFLVGKFFRIGRFFLAGKWKKKDLLLVVMANILTNPAVVLLYWLAFYYTSWNKTLVMIALELVAILVEWWYYKKYGEGFKRPFLFSVTANVISFTAGLLLQLIL